MTYQGDEYRDRFPRLIRAMMWVGALSESEAISAIVDYRDYEVKYGFGVQAVTNLGGPLPAIQLAIKDRRLAVRKYE